MNLLESAGFSRSNPYYVVQQGKVWTCISSSFCDSLFVRLNHRSSKLQLQLCADSVSYLNERLWTSGSAERDWGDPCVWREAAWELENNARNWQVNSCFFTCHPWILIVLIALCNMSSRKQEETDWPSCSVFGGEIEGTGWRKRRTTEIPAAWQTTQISRVHHLWQGTSWF